MITRRIVAAIVAGALMVAPLVVLAATPHPKISPTDAPTRQIIITVNGAQLEAEPAPRTVNDRLLVPIVRVFSALAISVSRSGDDLIATAPTKTIRVTLGSRKARVDNRVVMLDAPATEIDGATYVPLRFLTDAIGADVTYNAKAARIDIISALIGRVVEPRAIGGKTPITGTLTAIDRNSQPPSITLSSRASVRTISVNSTARITISDVNARSEQPGSLSDLHVGDAVSAILNKDGSVESIHDLYASRAGTVAAVSGNALVLDNGRVIAPDKTTEITLNGEAAKIGDLKIGDSVTQRSNPDSGETRQVIAVRKAPPAGTTAAPASDAIAIASLTATPAKPLKLGEALEITMRGTPGGRASYDLGSFFTGQPMREESAGVYRATLRVIAGLNFTNAALFGHLNVNGTEAPRAEASTPVSVATIVPAINDFAPGNGQVVNNNRPSVYATFVSPTDLGVNPGSVTIRVNGLDVTPSATRTTNFITYTSPVSLPDGAVTVTVSVADLAGNTASRSWTFTIRSK